MKTPSLNAASVAVDVMLRADQIRNGICAPLPEASGIYRMRLAELIAVAVDEAFGEGKQAAKLEADAIAMREKLTAMLPAGNVDEIAAIASKLDEVNKRLAAMPTGRGTKPIPPSRPLYTSMW